MSQTKSASTLSMMFIVVGNMLGAGILALPINLCATGVVPAVGATILMWIMMTYTALIYSRQKSLTYNEHADLPTFFGQELGSKVKWVTTVANMIILYGVLVAYLTGVSTIIMSLQDTLPSSAVMIAYFILVTGITAFGMKLMEKCNAFMVVLMWITFAVLLGYVMPEIDVSRFQASDWKYVPAGLPVLLMAFHFHNIIPTLCRSLGHDRKKINTAIIGGTTIGLVMNLVWIVAVLGALPLTSSGDINLMTAFVKNQPATVPLEKLLQSSTFTYIGLVFALVALSTSFMANGTALMSFMRDLCKTNFNKDSKALIWCISFLPPLVVGLIYPDIFLIAINVVGGVGENIIFGILPGFIVWKYAPKGSLKKYVGMGLIIFFGLTLLIEIGHEAGLLHISPDVEYWTHYTH